MQKLIEYFRRYTFKDVLVIMLLTLLYFLAGKLGLKLAFVNPSATPIWAPTGIALAAFLLLGYKYWPAILIGAFLVNLTTAGTVITSVGIAVGNTLEGLIGIFLVNTFLDKKTLFTKPENIFGYLILVGMLATAVAATFGATTLLLAGFVHLPDYGSVWLTWWLGDMGGAIVFAPVLILWFTDQLFPRSFAYFLELSLALVTLILVSRVIFIQPANGQFVSAVAVFFIIPILVWIAFRFGPRETITALLALYVIAAIGTLQGLGPFTRVSANQSLLELQIFMGLMFLGKMPLAAAALELKESEEKYKKLIATSPEAILVTDLTGRIQVVDQQVLNLFGLDDESEIVGKSGFDFIAPEDLGKTEEGLATILKTGKITNFEYQSVRSDGSRFYTSSNAAVIFNGRGQPEGIMIVSRDVTAEKEIERTKTEFVSLASHQLRTPLGIIKWYLEALQKEDYLKKAPEMIKKYFDEIYQSNERVLSLVRNLLLVSRIDEGRVRDNPKVANLQTIAQEVVEQMQVVAQKNQIVLSLIPPKTKLPQINIDALRLHEVIENLVGNALEYTPSGGKVEVKLEKNNSDLRLAVTDTGIGIAKKDQKKLFSKFFRSEKAVSQNPEGSGLGLYVVKSYVEGWGGQISVTSAEGQGSTFTITLPLNNK